MAARIAFLERLAPGVAGQSTVRPALPPRFAPTPPEGPFGNDLASALPVVSRDRPGAASEQRVGHESALDAPQSDGRPQPLIPTPPIAALPMSSTQPDLVVTGPLPAAPPSAMMASPRPVVLASATRDARVPPLGRDPEHGSTPPGAVDVQPVSEAAASTSLVDARAPLREIIVRQRAAIEASHAPTEVHMTIDRIDVRAPAAAIGRPAGPASQTRRAPSLSLADYLREREQARGSGGAR
jgi:hypothetical protein